MKKLFKTISEHRGHSVTCKKNADNPDIAEIWCDKCDVLIFSVNKKNDAFRYECVLSHQNVDISTEEDGKDHDIICVAYADVNAAIECQSCCEVIVDCDK